MVNWYKKAFIDDQKNTYGINVTSMDFDITRLIKIAQQDVALTPQQQQYIEHVADDVYEYIKDAIRERIEKQYINPGFIGDFATMEDMAQEGIIKAMEVVKKYWEPGEMPSPQHLWNLIKKSLTNMVTNLTQSMQPTTKKDELSRQYTDREPIYHGPLFNVVNFLDEKIREHFGERSLVYSDSQTIGEYVDYVTDEYRDEIIKMSKSYFDENITLKPNIPYQKQLEDFVDDKVIRRYKNRRRLERGGRMQFEYGDTEGLQDDILLSILGFEEMPSGTIEEQGEREFLAKFIKRAIESIPNKGVKMAAVLFFGLDPSNFGFNLSDEQIKNVLHKTTKGLRPGSKSEPSPHWGNIKSIVPSLVMLEGGSKEDIEDAESISNMGVKDFQKALSNYIQLVYRSHYSKPQNI